MNKIRMHFLFRIFILDNDTMQGICSVMIIQCYILKSTTRIENKMDYEQVQKCIKVILRSLVK